MMPRRALRALGCSSLSLILASALAACASRVAPPEAPMSVRRGDDAFRREDYETALNQYRGYTDSVGQGEYTPRALFKSALSSYRLGRYAATLSTLDDLSRRYPDATWVQVQALRGDTQRDLGKPQLALQAWDSGWSVANDVDKPKLKNRIRSVLPELNSNQLIEARQAAEEDEVKEVILAEIQSRYPDLAPSVIDPKHQKKVAEANGEAPARTLSEQVGRWVGSAPTPVAAPAAPAVASAAPAGAPAPAAPQAGSAAPAKGDLYAENTLMGTFQRSFADSSAKPAVAAAKAPAAPPAPKASAAEAPAAESKKAAVAKSAPAVAAPAVKAEAPARPSGLERLAKIDAGQDFNVDLDATPPPAPAPVEAPLVAAAPAAQPIAALAPIDAAPVEPKAPLSEDGPKVGCVLPLSGANRDLGEHVLRGLRLVFGDAAGRLVVRDSGSNDTVGARLVRALAEDDEVVMGIVAPGAGGAKAAAQAAIEKRFPILVLSDDAGVTGENVFQIRSAGGQSRADAIRSAVEFVARQQGMQTLGILRSDSADSLDVAKAFQAELGRGPAKVVASAAYDASTVPATVATLASWQREKSVQAVIVANDAVQVAALARAAQQQAPELWLIAVHEWPAVGGRASGFHAIAFAGSNSANASAAFLERYQTAYGVAPDARDAQAFDAATIAEAVLRRSVSQRSEVASTLDQVGSLEGAVGGLNVSRKGVRREATVLRVGGAAADEG